MTVDSRSIGHRIRAAREARQWSQNQLAERAGVDSGYISRLEAGKYVSPGHAKLTAIADALGRRVSDFTETARSVPGDDELRRMIVERLGPDRAEHALAILARMQNKSIDDLEKVVEITRVILD